MRFVPLLLAVLLPLCASAQETRPVSGTLTYRERMALPADAEMIVELRDGTGRIATAATRPTEGAQVPLPFALDAPAAQPLTLRAALRLGGGLRFLSDAVAIEGGTEPVETGEVMLRGFTPLQFTTTYSCGALTVELAPSDGGARLRVGGQYLDLAREPAASGAKYVTPGDAETWIWTKGDRAMLRLDGSEFPECRAMLPGTSYVARGNEPGWRVEIADGQIRYLGDYGATEIAAPLPAPESTDAAVRFAPEDADIRVTLALALCHDDMTGMPYPDTATVESGGYPLRGCGGDPMDLLTAHPWRVAEIAGESVSEAAEVTMAFGPDGQVSGRGGCNSYTGRMALGGEGLELGPMAATMMACAEDLMARERRFFEALPQVHRFEIGPDGSLRLIAGDTPLIVAHR